MKTGDNPSPDNDTWDVIVVGTGMGGSVIGHELAKNGRRVLFLEKGRNLLRAEDRGDGALPLERDDRPEARLQKGHWPLPLAGATTFGDSEFFAPLGCGTGGSANLYAAQLERMSPCDFEPRRFRPDGLRTTLPDRWPVRYEDFVPYYRKAEDLFHVTGTPDPLNNDLAHAYIPPPRMSARDEAIFSHLAQRGMHPYRAHVGSDFKEGCGECGGVLCPRFCKNDPGKVALLPALQHHGARLLTDCEALRIEADRTRATGVLCEQNGNRMLCKAKIIIVAAGSLFSPVLLLKSRSDVWTQGLANSSGLVGKNLMWHATDFIAVKPKRPLPIEGPKKAFALNDFYLHNGMKLGNLQSVGVPVNWQYVYSFLRTRTQKMPPWQRCILPRPLLRLMARAGSRFFQDTAILALITEDFPYEHNRVFHDERAVNQMRFSYTYPEELRLRSASFYREAKALFSDGFHTFKLSGKNNLNVGHACGTCRFGDDPKTSVLDADNRCHDLDNLYVVDGSFFPSSGGTNPSLTIAANALRVADAILRTRRNPVAP